MMICIGSSVAPIPASVSVQIVNISVLYRYLSIHCGQYRYQSRSWTTSTGDDAIAITCLATQHTASQLWLLVVRSAFGTSTRFVLLTNRRPFVLPMEAKGKRAKTYMYTTQSQEAPLLTPSSGIHRILPRNLQYQYQHRPVPTCMG